MTWLLQTNPRGVEGTGSDSFFSDRKSYRRTLVGLKAAASGSARP